MLSENNDYEKLVTKVRPGLGVEGTEQATRDMLRAAWTLFPKERFDRAEIHEVREETAPNLVFARPDMNYRMAKKVRALDQDAKGKIRKLGLSKAQSQKVLRNQEVQLKAENGDGPLTQERIR